MRHNAVVRADPGQSISIPDSYRHGKTILSAIKASSFGSQDCSGVAMGAEACWSGLIRAPSANARAICGQSPQRCVGQSNPAKVRDGHSSNSDR
jgi:hypothetical protein